MLFRTVRAGKRAALTASAAGLATAASLALAPASPALAAPVCNTFSPGGVSFSVCIAKIGSGGVEASVGNISGTYISGDLAVYEDGELARSSCSGQFHAGSDCDFTHWGESGSSYKATWRAKDGSRYDSDTISA